MNALDWVAVGIIGLVLAWAFRVLYVGWREQRWAQRWARMGEGCDRTRSMAPNACEDRWHDLPNDVARYLRAHEGATHVCSKCGRPILITIGRREVLPSRWN